MFLVDIIKATQQGQKSRLDANVGALWHNLANTSKPSVCGGDAALCQFTF